MPRKKQQKSPSTAAASSLGSISSFALGSIFALLAVSLVDTRSLSQTFGSMFKQQNGQAQLYYSSTSCGAASYIAAYKAGLIPSIIVPNEVNLRTHVVAKGSSTGKDFYTINPKGNVPTLILPDGSLLNENAAVLQYIADQNPSAKLAPPSGTSARYVLQSKLNWLSSELHVAIGSHFSPTLTAEQKAHFSDRAERKLKYLNDVELKGGKRFLVGDVFTIADSYCAVILSWTKVVGIDISEYANVVAYLEGVNNLDFVKGARSAMEKEK